MEAPTPAKTPPRRGRRSRFISADQALAIEGQDDRADAVLSERHLYRRLARRPERDGPSHDPDLLAGPGLARFAAKRAGICGRFSQFHGPSSTARQPRPRSEHGFELPEVISRQAPPTVSRTSSSWAHTPHHARALAWDQVHGRVLVRPKAGILDRRGPQPSARSRRSVLPASAMCGSGRLDRARGHDPATLRTMCERLLANPLIEEYEILDG